MITLSMHQLKAVSPDEVRKKLGSSQMRHFFAYGTLRPGEYNFSKYQQGIRAEGTEYHLVNASLWTHGPYPFLLNEHSPDKQVLIEKMEFVKVTTAIEILQMESAAGYQSGLIDGTLIFYWPGDPASLNQYLRKQVVEITTGNWQDYKSSPTL